MDVSEQDYRLRRGPRQHKRIGFGVDQAARLLRFQPNNGVLRRKMRWPPVFMSCCSTAHGYRNVEF